MANLDRTTTCPPPPRPITPSLCLSVYLEECWYEVSPEELVAALAPVLLLVEGHKQHRVPETSDCVPLCDVAQIRVLHRSDRVRRNSD